MGYKEIHPKFSLSNQEDLYVKYINDDDNNDADDDTCIYIYICVCVCGEGYVYNYVSTFTSLFLGVLFLFQDPP